MSALCQVLLQPSRQELLNRLQARMKVGGHFMPASLLDSQLATLEPQGRNLIALQGGSSFVPIQNRMYTKQHASCV